MGCCRIPRMGRLIPVLLLLSLSGCTMWKENPVTSWDSATGGEHLVRLFWQDVKNKKWDDIEKRLAPTFVAVLPTGTLDRQAAIARFRALDLQDVSLGEVSVQPGGGEQVVVTYSLLLRGPATSPPLRAMTVWQQHKQDWLAVAHSEVPQTQP